MLPLARKLFSDPGCDPRCIYFVADSGSHQVRLLRESLGGTDTASSYQVRVQQADGGIVQVLIPRAVAATRQFYRLPVGCFRSRDNRFA